MRKARVSRVHRHRPLSSSRMGQMPFSIIAVLLLILSSTSIALVYGLEERGSDAIPAHLLVRMKDRLTEEVQAVARLAYNAASEAAKGAGSLNETKFHEAFIVSLNSSLSSSYPSDSEGIVAQVYHSLKLSFLRASLEEDAAHYRDEGSWQGASVPAYFVITGNYTINVSCTRGHLGRTVEMDQGVYVPLPLLMYKLEKMVTSTGPKGEMENMVRYMLSTLAQDRVLHGYGAGAKTGVGSTEAVLTEEDVVRAVNLALFLEEMHHFGTAGEGGLADLPIGPVDPADLFLRSYGEGGLDLAPIIAQTIYSRLDMIVLKWMEYYGLIDLANLGDDFLEGSANSIIDTIDLLTGGDMEKDAVIAYVTSALVEAGVPEYIYKWFCYGGGDALVDLPEFKICFVDDRGNHVYRVFDGTFAVDFPGTDIFVSPEWGEVSRRYRDETYAVAQTMTSYLRSVAAAVASRCSLPLIDPILDPSDGLSYMEELDRQLRAVFDADSSWLSPAVDAAAVLSEVRDGMAQALLDFIDQRWMELFRMNAAMYQSASGLSAVLVHELDGAANFTSSSLESARTIILAELLGDNWGAREVLQAAFVEKATPTLQALELALALKTSEKSLLADLLSFGVSSLPGIELLLGQDVMATIQGMGAGLEAQGGASPIGISTDGVALTLADGQQRTERFSVGSSELIVGGGKNGGWIDVRITVPWNYDRSSTAYPNRHVTDLRDLTSTPFSTQWGVEYHGSVVLEVGVEMAGAGSLPCTTIIAIDGAFNVLTFSGWGLIGVEYAPTTTLMQEVRELLLDIWDFLVSSVQALGNLLGRTFELFAQLLTELLSYATAPLEMLSDILSQALERIQQATVDLIGMVIQALADTITSVLNGTTLKLSVLGVTIAVVIGPSDSYLSGAEDRIRTDLSLSALGTTLTSSVRVLRLADGRHTIAATASLGGDGWSADLTLDPLMMVYDHQVEVRGYLGGHLLEIVCPDVERVQKASLSLSDVPLLSQALRSIPSPIPGTKFSVDAGIEMSFHVMDRTAVLINEVELNPQGTDASREWVELYNPSPAPVDVSGWTLATTRGRQHSEALSGTIPAYGYLVHRFSGQALDNGEVKGFPVQESVALLDRSGKRVDSAPWLKDLADDSRSWQRSTDGSSRWELRADSEGRTNGLALLTEVNTDQIIALMEECFLEAFQRFIDTGLDLWALDEIIQDALSRLKDRMLGLVESTVSSLKFFFQLGLSDVTGTGTAGVSTALVYDGRAVRECLEWLIDAVGEVLRDPLNPLAAAGRAEVPVQALADHVFLQVGVFASVGAPDILSVGAGMKLTASAIIKVNLGALGVFEGSGKWDLHFGLVITGVETFKVKGQPVGLKGACCDVWVLRGALRPA